MPFIARYRKEATGTLDDTQLRTLEERLRYLRELEERRAAILGGIGEQGKLDDALRQAIQAGETRHGSKTFICPTSRNGEPRHRSPAKWPQAARRATCCCPSERDPRQAAAGIRQPGAQGSRRTMRRTAPGRS